MRHWPAYEVGLKRRGDLTLWPDETAIAGWQAARRSTPGDQAWHSDATIGLTTLSRHSRGFAARKPEVVPHGPMHLVIDSTGPKPFGRGEWDAEKHGRARRPWRKLRIAVDAGAGEIVACALTDNGADDAGEVPSLLEQFQGAVAGVTTDGAYDGEPVYRAIADHQPDPPPDVVVPPRASAVPSTEDADAQGQRDRHILSIAQEGRMAWQRATGYGRRSLAETAVGRYKAIIGPRPRACILPARQGEAASSSRCSTA